MAESIDDYLLDHDGVDWPEALGAWAWLVPDQFTIWLVTCFGDLIVILDDGSVHRLDVVLGTFTRLADDREGFEERLNEDGNAEAWLSIALVDDMADAGKVLGPGECFGFETPPVLGGGFTVDNAGPRGIEDYLQNCGWIHEQLRDIPDGERVSLSIEEGRPILRREPPADAGGRDA